MISKTDFINSIQKIVIPKMTALQRTQKTPISNYIGLLLLVFAIAILVLLFLPAGATLRHLIFNNHLKFILVVPVLIFGFSSKTISRFKKTWLSIVGNIFPANKEYVCRDAR